jgi:hypothetical protein
MQMLSASAFGRPLPVGLWRAPDPLQTLCPELLCEGTRGVYDECKVPVRAAFRESTGPELSGCRLSLQRLLAANRLAVRRIGLLLG